MGTQVCLRLPQEMVRRLSRLAEEERKSRSELIREVLQEYINGNHAEAADYPYARVKDLLGSVRGGPTDLGAERRERIKGLVRDRR